MRGILPDEVLTKKKHGFGVPVGMWFFQDQRLKSMVRDVLSDSRTRQRGAKGLLSSCVPGKDELAGDPTRMGLLRRGDLVAFVGPRTFGIAQHLESKQRQVEACVRWRRHPIRLGRGGRNAPLWRAAGASGSPAGYTAPVRCA